MHQFFKLHNSSNCFSPLRFQGQLFAHAIFLCLYLPLASYFSENCWYRRLETGRVKAIETFNANCLASRVVWERQRGIRDERVEGGGCEGAYRRVGFSWWQWKSSSNLQYTKPYQSEKGLVQRTRSFRLLFTPSPFPIFNPDKTLHKTSRAFCWFENLSNCLLIIKKLTNKNSCSDEKW